MSARSLDLDRLAIEMVEDHCRVSYLQQPRPLSEATRASGGTVDTLSKETRLGDKGQKDKDKVQKQKAAKKEKKEKVRHDKREKAPGTKLFNR